VALSVEVALDYLLRAHEQNRLGHAYLVAGQPGSGKRKLAAKLTAAITGVSADAVFAVGSEVHIAEPESKSRRIVIEQIRSLEHSLQMRSPTGRRKVAIISDADRLQPQAANAFLKTLEEPPNDSLLLLLTAMPEVLPDTIVSRCIALQLEPPTGDRRSPEETELLDLLAKASVDCSGDVQAAYRMLQGFQQLVARTRQAIQEENAAALQRDEAKYKNTTEGTWLANREEHYKALGESVYLQRRARLVDLIFLWWSDVLRASTGIVRSELPKLRERTTVIASRLDTAGILRRLKALEELRDQLGRNIQEALALEVAFLRVFRF
jgi:DNA polymerase-3 subunit delta'